MEQEKYLAVRDGIKRELLSDMDFTREMSDEEIQDAIADRLRAREFAGRLNVYERARMGKELFFTIRGLDVLQELIEDEQVTEIMINGMEGIFVERAGRLFAWPCGFESGEKLQDVIQQIVAGCNRVVNETSPIVDARLENGSRVNVVLGPIALNGPVVTIRRFPEQPIGMRELLAIGSISEEACSFLEKLVKARYNIFISGGTNSGKTTFLNALSSFIPPQERVITIEDSAELQITQVPNLVRLETRNANTEGEGEITMSQLIRASLRMNPTRIIVGEVRGRETLDMLQAMNTGHDGSLSTGHGNSARDMLSRLETMVLMAAELPLPAIRSQIASALDIMVHLGRLRDGSRKVLSIAEIGGCTDGEVEMESLYEYDRKTGRLEAKGLLKNREKLGAAGYCQRRE